MFIKYHKAETMHDVNSLVLSGGLHLGAGTLACNISYWNRSYLLTQEINSVKTNFGGLFYLQYTNFH